MSFSSSVIGRCFKHLVKYPANEHSHSLMLHLQFKYGGVEANQDHSASLQRPAHVENILKHAQAPVGFC